MRFDRSWLVLFLLMSCNRATDPNAEGDGELSVRPSSITADVGQTFFFNADGKVTQTGDEAATLAIHMTDGCVEVQHASGWDELDPGLAYIEVQSAGFEEIVEAKCLKDCEDVLTIELGLHGAADDGLAIVGQPFDSQRISVKCGSGNPSDAGLPMADAGGAPGDLTDPGGGSGGTGGSGGAGGEGTPAGALSGVFSIGAGLEQVIPVPQEVTTLLDVAAAVYVAGSAASYLVELTGDADEPTRIIGEGAASIGGAFAPHPGDPTLWDLFTYGVGDGSTALLVGADGIGAFGYRPFGVSTNPHVTDMRTTQSTGDTVIAYAGGTHSGQLVDTGSDYSYDVSLEFPVGQSLSLLIPGASLQEPWFVVTDGTPGALYGSDDATTPIGDLGDSPRLGDCHLGQGSEPWAMCAVPNYGDGTVQFIDVEDDGSATISDPLDVGGAVVRVTALQVDGERYWLMPVYDTGEVIVCQVTPGGCATTQRSDVPNECEGPGHATGLGDEWIATSCNTSGNLWVAAAAELLP